MSIKEKLRVLIVDDTATSRGLICKSMEELGIKNFKAASDGQDALNNINQSPYHLVISDYNMPNMDGLALLKKIRTNAATHRTGFILITGAKDPELINKGKKLGMNNFLQKPVTTEKLKACMEAVIGPL